MRSNEGAGLASQHICGISNFPLYRKIVLIQTWSFANHRRGSQEASRSDRKPASALDGVHSRRNCMTRWWGPCEVRRSVARISAALRFEQNTDHDIGIVFTMLRLREFGISFDGSRRGQEIVVRSTTASP
jgi:hypothetical protein